MSYYQNKGPTTESETAYKKIRISDSKWLAQNEQVRLAIDILNFALDAVNPENLIKKSLKRKGFKLEIQATLGRKIIDLEAFHQIFMVAIGKAAPLMAKAFLEILGDRVDKGIVVCYPRGDFSWPGIEKLEAPHPFPDERSIMAAEKILALKREVKERALIFFLISGGASAQIVKPIRPVTLNQKVELIKALMQAGADIKELNVVRKHLSEIKGGKLGKFFSPATIINIFISDVVDDDLETIASAPTTWDNSTFMDSKKIIMKYKLWEKSPDSIKEIIEKGIQGEIEETRKIGEINHEKLLNFVVGNVEVAARAASAIASQMGFLPLILTLRERGEARNKAVLWASLIKNLSLSPQLKSNSYALISGGELTVTVKGQGKGGRNTEFCLALLKELIKEQISEDIRWCGASLATDGHDGPTEAAGALIFPEIIQEVISKCLDIKDYLESNDSLTFFEKIGSSIITGPTGTNVMDLRLFLFQKNA